MTTTQINQVKIGKSIYDITASASPAVGIIEWTLSRGSERKSLVYSEALDRYTLANVSARLGKMKIVRVEFIR